MNTLQRRLAEKRANEEAGFTLIELLVVIVILGILAAVVVFSVRGIVDRGDNSACEATKTAILTGAEAAVAADPVNKTKTLIQLQAAGFISAGGGTIIGNDFAGKNFTLTYVPSATTAPATVTPVCPV